MSPPHPLPLTVIGGYLGAGKTTVVNALLAAPAGRRFGVVVNDIGEVNIDASLVAAEEDNMVTLGNGCVCCSAVDGFHTALVELMDPVRGIDHVIVEVSGVGDPWKVAQWGRTPGLELDAVVVLADAEQVHAQARDRYVGDTVLAQLRGADLVLLSKTDLVPDTVDDVIGWIASVCDAPVLCPERGARSTVAMLDAARTGSGGPTDATHATHRSWSVAPGGERTKAEWLDWLGGAPIGVVRVKGFVPGSGETLVLQRVGKRCEVTRWRGAEVQAAVVVVATAAADAGAVEHWLATC